MGRGDAIQAIVGEEFGARVVAVVGDARHVAVIGHAEVEIVFEIEEAADGGSAGTSSGVPGQSGPGSRVDPAGLENSGPAPC